MSSPQINTYQFNDYSLAIESKIDTSLIDQALPTAISINIDSIDLVLCHTEQHHGLSLQWLSAPNGQLKFTIDVESLVKQHHSFPIAKQGAFNQALGKKTNTIIDASGGWGTDALLMAMQGYQVTVIERQPIMALLLQEAFARFARIEWVQDNSVIVPSLKFGNFEQLYLDQQLSADCLYFDPMFPAKRKKSAAANKQMQLLQWLVGQDLDAASVVSTVLNTNIRRIAVKRPAYAEPLLEKPSEHFSSKLVHYDVYLNQ